MFKNISLYNPFKGCKITCNFDISIYCKTIETRSWHIPNIMKNYANLGTFGCIMARLHYAPYGALNSLACCILNKINMLLNLN